MAKFNVPVCLLLASVGCTAESSVEPETPPPPVETCSAATPVCDPGCSSAEICLFQDGACGCVAQCDSTNPVCAGAGCETGFFCDTSCTCVEEIACLPDAPTCDGNGPNAGCDDGFACNSSCGCEQVELPPADVLARPSRSTTIDISRDDSLLAMVNTDDGSVSFFNARDGQESRIARVSSSDEPAGEPMSVVIHPDQERAFVANRASGTIVRIADAHTTQPRLDAELEVGGEPIGLALDPTGRTLWATNWVSGEVYAIDTASMQLERTIDVGGNPWAIAITNDGDQESDDEKVLVTQFFGRRRAGVVTEGTDDGREGVLQIIPIADPTELREVTLAPLSECFVSPDQTSGCFPNQLYGVTVHRAFGSTRAYVVSVAASPAGPVTFNHNVQALVSVVDLDTEQELPALTKNLNELIKAQQIDTDGDDAIGRRFLSVANAIDFVNRDDVIIGYVTAGGSDVVVRVQYLEDGTVTVGSPLAFNMAAGQSPTGLVVKHSTVNGGAFVANLISRDVSILSFRDQAKVRDIESTPIPSVPTSEAFRIWRGKRFFNTGTGIWSKEGWGSCQGCHPMGLTDNVTWQFAAGPRQTISLDGQYASNDPEDMRALNWTAIFDETADFELNTRGVSGGTGAIRNDGGPIVSDAGPPFSAVVVEDGSTENHQALNGSLTFLARNTAVCTNANTCPDWDLIDAYIRSVRSPRAPASAADQVARGRLLFEDAGCTKCHAGPKWTVSRTFYVPETFSGDLPSRLFETNRAASIAMDPSQLAGLPQDVNLDATLIAGDDSDGGAPALKRQACNIRNVGTFGAAGGAEEVRANGQPAQGRNGFNPPSLLGLSVGAPYLHHGAAASLEDLLDVGRFSSHIQAGNPNFVPTADDRAALAAFLTSIDESTETFSIGAGTLLCPDLR